MLEKKVIVALCSNCSHHLLSALVALWEAAYHQTTMVPLRLPASQITEGLKIIAVYFFKSFALKSLS